MKALYRFAAILGLVLLFAMPSPSQFKDQGVGGGVSFGGTFGQTELRDRQGRFIARAFLRYGLTSFLQGEVGGALGTIAGTGYKTLVVPLDYRFVISPFSFSSWNPYLYAGAGMLYYNIEEMPRTAPAGTKDDGWVPFFPGGLGLQFLLSDRVAFEMSGGFNYTLDDKYNGVEVGEKDAYWVFALGLTAVGESGSADPDQDGLTNKEEKQLGTDPKKADTDGDGLNDGAEINRYKTDALKADSDGDGLKDGEEVNTEKTDPNKADTDGDGLSDGNEVNTAKTDPLKADTDGDGLNDGAEVNTYKTDPLKADTDGDGLSDGNEVNTSKTDPLKADTDGGTVNDGAEVARGSNPLDATDDVPKKEELKVEVGKAIVLEGVVFASGKSDITPASEEILEKAFNTLNQNPEVEVEIQGHTDNVGGKALNTRLSLARADAVKAWLVQKGIEDRRITTKGFGPSKPIASNATAAGRQKNRRIEFFRTK